jgi:hypothetical protein
VVAENGSIYRLSDAGIAKGHAPWGALGEFGNPDSVKAMGDIAERLEDLVRQYISG